ncbi:MAG: hypothetical protein ACFFD4_10625 [Candidatus Odinarchaeota archaeon]
MSVQEALKRIIQGTKQGVLGFGQEHKRLVALSSFAAPFVIISILLLIPMMMGQPGTDTVDLPLAFHSTSGTEQLSTEACATCHTVAVTYDNCTDCHDGSMADPPSTMVGVSGYISFPHHDPDAFAASFPDDEEFANCSNAMCHDAESDFRYVRMLEANHTYCDYCHDFTHSPPASLAMASKAAIIPGLLTLLTIPIVVLTIRRLF